MLRVGDLVDLAEDGCFGALTAPELDALRRVWPDHLVIRTTLDERQNSPVVATTTGANITPTVSGISDQSTAGSLRRHANSPKLFGRTSAASSGHCPPHAFLHSMMTYRMFRTIR